MVESDALGPAGRPDGEGCCPNTGHAKDLIVVGGRRIYALKVEDAIAAHPGVGQVVVRNLFGGEAMQVLIDWTKLRIERLEAPKAVVLVDRLPRNALGKVLEHQLRAERLAAMGENA